MHVKVVDDNDMIADLLRRVLIQETDDGEAWKVEAVTGGFADLLRHDRWIDVDVAILDLMLSDPDINGGHIARWLKQHMPRVKVIVLTAISPHFILDDATDLEVLVDLVINKPTSPLVLPEIIRAVTRDG